MVTVGIIIVFILLNLYLHTFYLHLHITLEYRHITKQEEVQGTRNFFTQLK